ncbi:MAG TPA: Fur family transcriptional regulator [Gaiellaceae bacterium]|nr:Fur family transcriptional regulator [Gaiellaceae bacterium]
MSGRGTDAVEALRAAGLRPTRHRVAVLDELALEPNDVTAQELWQRLRARGGSVVGRATVYRALAAMREHRVIDAFAHHDGELCYRVCTNQHHHHLVCRECHRVVELVGCDVGDWVARAGRRHGFAALEHELELSGVCADCRAA